MGIIELLHTPCGCEVLAYPNQKDLFFIPLASAHAFRTIPGPRKNTLISRFCRIRELPQEWEKTKASGP